MRLAFVVTGSELYLSASGSGFQLKLDPGTTRLGQILYTFVQRDE
jgi:hypothetical protein